MKKIETSLWRQKGRWLVFIGKQIDPSSNFPRIPQLSMHTETLRHTQTPYKLTCGFLNLSFTLLSHRLFLMIKALTNLSYNLPDLFFCSGIPYTVDRGKRHFNFSYFAKVACVQDW